jgi:hypothetical protein
MMKRVNKRLALDARTIKPLAERPIRDEELARVVGGSAATCSDHCSYHLSCTTTTN